ncbi:MAG: hypothetical protein CMJ78_04825 [Planctomycetaceae bacterium]|nr:hypothetical protein [Planctomycetaceae bacterium]
MLRLQVVVVTFDSLPTSHLGCYGSEWVETPQLDALAAESAVFDSHFGTDFCELESQSTLRYAWKTGSRAGWAADNQASFTDNLQTAGVDVKIIEEASFADCSFPLTTVMDEAKAWLQSTNANSDWLLWLLVEGLSSNSVCPAEYAEIYEEDFTDDDELRLASAAYVSYADQLIGGLLQASRTPSSNSPAIVVAAARGIDAEAPDQIQGPQLALSEAFMRTPMIIHDPSSNVLHGNRCPALTQTIDLPATILDLFQIPDHPQESQSLLPLIRGETTKHREELLMTRSQSNWTSIRTTDWHYIEDLTDVDLAELDHDELPMNSWLFSKPEDVWDCQDVKADFFEIVMKFSTRLRKLLNSHNLHRRE